MRKRNLFVILTVVFAGAALALSRVIWPDPADGISVPASLLPFFIGVAFFEALGFGVGMSLLLLYWKKGKENLPVFLSVIWYLISWWPHDNLHRVIGHDLVPLLKVEYGFHVTLIIASCIIARYFIKNVWSTKATEQLN